MEAGPKVLKQRRKLVGRRVSSHDEIFASLCWTHGRGHHGADLDLVHRDRQGIYITQFIAFGHWISPHSRGLHSALAVGLVADA